MQDADFALIGHQDSWKAADDSCLARADDAPLPEDEINIPPWIPPRPVCHVEVTRSSIIRLSAQRRGDCTSIRSFRPTAWKPPRARQHGAGATRRPPGRSRLERRCEPRRIQLDPDRRQLRATSGKARDRLHHGQHADGWFIVQGIKRMCALEGRDLRRSTLLIVGATGDVGSGCARVPGAAGEACAAERAQPGATPQDWSSSCKERS